MSWRKNTKAEPYIVNVPNLQKYHEIVSEKGTEFNVGDIIKLKKEVFLPKKNAGCSTNPEDENFYACVVRSNSSTKSGHIRLGLNEDLRIAVVCQGVVSIRTVDSRLFWKCPNDVIPNLPAVKLLMEFTEDKPIIFLLKKECL